MLEVKDAPFGVGKPLGFEWFRELKVGKYRVYYLIYESAVLVVLIDLSSKKDQQEVIAAIKEDLSFFRSVFGSVEERNINDGR